MNKYKIDWILTTRRNEAEQKARKAQAQMMKDDAYAEAVRELKQAGAQLLLRQANGGDTAALKKRLQALETVKDERLHAKGLSALDLHPQYTCPLCNDTGRKEDHTDCDCKRQLLLEQLMQEDPSAGILAEETFQTFDLTLFRDRKIGEEPVSPREMMREMRNTALIFTRKFAEESDRNLLLYGPVGSGKSFLCHAIARELIEQGVPVVYQTAYGMQELFQSVRFAPSQLRAEREVGLDRLRKADLLVIDDLGTETVHAVSIAHFFELLNDRLLEKKSTIISTNLEPREIERIYSPRVFSRIFGQYELYNIFGDDLRMRV